jgi:hypothetical protein
MARVPRVDSYQGFVFGSLARHGPALAEHLGAAAGEIDRLARLSPEGQVELTAGECVQHSTAVQLKGAPELNQRVVSQSVGSIGPAGMLLADDSEMYERNQRGVAILQPEWLDLRRGLHRDEHGLIRCPLAAAGGYGPHTGYY